MYAAIAAIFAQGLASQALRALAMKVFLRMLLIAIVPLLTMLAFNTVLGAMVDYVISEVNAVSPGTTTGYNFSGMFLYLYAQLGLDIAIAAIVGAMSTKMLLRSIPFVRL